MYVIRGSNIIFFISDSLIFENERQSKVFKIIHLNASSSDVLQIVLRVHDAQNYFILKDFDQLKSLQAGKCQRLDGKMLYGIIAGCQICFSFLNIIDKCHQFYKILLWLPLCRITRQNFKKLYMNRSPGGIMSNFFQLRDATSKPRVWNKMLQKIDFLMFYIMSRIYFFEMQAGKYFEHF